MMNYRLLEVTSLYQKYLDLFNSKNPLSSQKSYSDYMRDILDDCNAECDFIHIELQKIGISTDLVFYNIESLQKSWNLALQDSNLFDIFLAQLKQLKPDVLLVSDLSLFNVDQMNIIKQSLPFTTKIVGYHFTLVTMNFINVAPLYDQIYTGSLYFCEILRPYCKDIKLLRHAFDGSILNKINSEQRNRKNSVVFPGSIMLGDDVHTNRIDLLSSFIEQDIRFDFFGSVYGSFYSTSKVELLKQILLNNKLLKNRKATERYLKKSSFPNVFGLEYYQTLTNYNICLNIHAPIIKTGAGNMRMFESTGMGTCLLTDERSENKDLFELNTEIVTYSNFDDCVEKAKWLINNPEKATQIALNGQKKTLSEHTYKNKAEKMNLYICELFV